MGYLQAKSFKSLTAGLLCGGSLAIAAFLAQTHPRTGLGIASIIAVQLVLIFGTRFQKTRKFMPAGFLAILSLAMAITFVTAFFGIA